MAGASPDIILNPMCLTRMTQGLLTELLLGSARPFAPAAISQFDTIFVSKMQLETKIRMARSVFCQMGMSSTGKVGMTRGDTGRPIHCHVFSGIAYVRVLKQMSKEKLRSRDRGPVNDMTRQPTVGKKQLGGLRQGEQENFNTHSLGMAKYFRNVNFETGSKARIVWCNRCQTRGISCAETGLYLCNVCHESDALVRLRLPYIGLLTPDELMTAGFGHRFLAEQDTSLESVLDEEALFAAAQENED